MKNKKTVFCCIKSGRLLHHLALTKSCYVFNCHIVHRTRLHCMALQSEQSDAYLENWNVKAEYNRNTEVMLWLINEAR